MQKKDLLVSIIILNWNGLEDTKLCLDSILSIDYPNYEILLIDNGSTDGSVQYFHKLSNAKIKFISLPTNQGFTGGHIAGYKESSGDILFLVNNDSVVDPSIVTRAVNIFKEDCKIAAIGGRAYFWDKSNKPYNTKNDFYSYQEINPVTAEAKTLNYDNGRCEPNNISGSAVFIRKSVVDRLGYFDNNFFAYYEETDLFARFKQAGYKIIYDPSLQIWHKNRASTKKKQDLYYYLMFRNQFQFAYKNFSKLLLLAFLKKYFKDSVLKALIKFTIGRDRQINKALLKSTVWNIIHFTDLKKRRASVQKNAKTSYSLKILSETLFDMTIIIDYRKVSNLDSTLRSITNQKTKVLEVLIVTDAKGEASARSAMSHINNVRLIIDRKTNLATGIELGAICAKGRWLCYLKPGQMMKPNAIQNARIYTSTNPRTELLLYKNCSTGKLCINRTLSFFGAIIEKRHITKVMIKQPGHSIAWLLRHSIRSGIKYQFIKDELIIGTSNSKIFDYELLDFIQGYFNKICRYSLIVRKMIPRKFTTFRRVLVANIVLLFITNKKKLFIRSLLDSKRSLKQKLINNYEDYMKQKTLKTCQGNIHKKKLDMSEVVAFINCRDRIETLKKLIDWLEVFGIKNIILVDNKSSYKPLLDYYKKTQCQVLPLDRNAGHKAPWDSMAIPIMAKNRYYILSDPDIIPVESCPVNAIEYFFSILQKYKNIQKVGFGLKIDDIPDYYHLKDTVIKWEKQFWLKEIEPNIYLAPIDTTFALYRPNSTYELGRSLRTGKPYIARHAPWYQNLEHLSSEEKYYMKSSSELVNTWNKKDIPDYLKKALSKNLK